MTELRELHRSTSAAYPAHSLASFKAPGFSGLVRWLLCPGSNLSHRHAAWTCGCLDDSTLAIEMRIRDCNSTVLPEATLVGGNAQPIEAPSLWSRRGDGRLPYSKR